jgi:hypothetical protein
LNLAPDISAVSSRPDGPDFLCIGAQKAGTGWLYNQLNGHPDFWLPPLKELHYFDDPRRFRQKFAKEKLQRASRRDRLIRNGRWPPDERDSIFYQTAREISDALRPDPDAYARLFDQKRAQLSGDLTPAYSTLDEEAIAGIARRFPAVKIVLILREPIDRFWSQLCMEVRDGTLRLQGPADLEGIMRFAEQRGVVARSFPSMTFEKWSPHICRGRMGVFFFDDLRSDPAFLRKSIFSFLGADPGKTNGRKPSFNRKQAFTKLVMPDAVRESLRSYFSSEIRRCSEMFGGPAATWPSRYGL